MDPSSITSPLLYTKTESGLSYKDLAKGDGDVPEQGSLVQIMYNTSLLSGRQNMMEMPSELTFRLGDPRYDFFNEAIANMTIGSSRRVNVLPSSRFALPFLDETVQLEVQLLRTRTGLDALAYQLGQQRLNIFLFLLFFGGDIANLINSLVHDPSSAAWAAQGLAHAGIAPTVAAGAAADAAAAAAQQPALVDAANAWAAAGLAQVGL